MTHDKPEVIKNVIEFGNEVMVSLLMNNDEVVDNVLTSHLNGVKHALDYITDVEYLGDVEFATDSQLDPLGRFITKGYRFKVASEGYNVLQRHFKCKEKHEPHELTLEYITDLIERYAEQQKYAEDDE
jgi:hypothetical protein